MGLRGGESVRVYDFPDDMGGDRPGHPPLRAGALLLRLRRRGFDEANNLARSAGVELSDGFSSGPNPLAKVTGPKVHLRDYSERGEDPALGLAAANGDDGRVIDVLHGLLWHASHRRHELKPYLDETRPDAARLRLVAQALQGKGLREEGESKPAEAQACERLLSSWRSIVEENLFSGG